MSTLFILNQYGILVNGGHRASIVKMTQAQINHYNFQVENLILQEIVKRKTGQIILEGIRSSGWSVVVMPHDLDPRKCAAAATVARPEMEKGYTNVGVLFSPEMSCLDSKSQVPVPGGSPAEALFHELVHAFNAVTGTPYDGKLHSNPFLPEAVKKNLPQYDNEDDFFAILITNIFSSETGRPLRGGHKGFEALPPHLSTDDGFVAVEDYARLVKKFCDDHPSISRELSKMTSDYNPIRRVLNGPFAKALQQIEGRPRIPMVQEVPKATKSIPRIRP